MSIDLARIKVLLEARRTELRESLEELAEDTPSSGKQEEANRDPTDREEVALDVNERQDEWFVRVNQQKLLAEVEGALGRIEQGTYGLCVQCGQPIPEKRLLTLPWAARDIVCQQQLDDQERLAASPQE
ncbi:MAG TPA: TraR/DksA C4-type zinc finger protein [Ktedonobacteraceae bacterium]|nr:TraR/DksA C4-type zinc finger protein [Ktedonobacteraceae bacterium]